MHTVTFFYTASDGQITVDLASWEILHLTEELEELRVRTSHCDYDIVIGDGLLGRFVYFPKQGLGFPADDLLDVTRSNTQLCTVFEYEDAVAVASALRDYASC